MGLTRLQPGDCCGCEPPPCTAFICVTGCPSGAELVGAIVEVDETDGTFVSSAATVDNGGTACVGSVIGTFGIGAGTYKVIVTNLGYHTYSGLKSLTCGGTTNIQLQATATPATAVFTVTGCCSLRLPGATVTLSDGQVGTTDSSGQWSAWIGKAGTYTYTISYPRFVDLTGSFTVPSDCYATTQSFGGTMTPATGYTCPPRGPDGASHVAPIATTLHATDSVYGAITLTYSSGTWTGTTTGSFPGGCGCPSASFPLTYTLNQCPLTNVLLGSWHALEYAQCIFGSPTVLQSKCPADASLATTCAGKANGSNILFAGGTQPAAYGWGTGGGLSWSVTSWVPFSASFTIPSCTCGSNAAGDLSCGGATGAYTGIPWPSGGTVTFTE